MEFHSKSLVNSTDFLACAYSRLGFSNHRRPARKEGELSKRKAIVLSLFPKPRVGGTELNRCETCQTVCKPVSAPAGAGDDHSSGTPVAGRLARPTRMATRKPA